MRDCDVYHMLHYLACWIPPPSNLIVVNLFCDIIYGIHGHGEGSSLPVSVCGRKGNITHSGWQTDNSLLVSLSSLAVLVNLSMVIGGECCLV